MSEPTDEELADGLASVCPGCYSVGAERCPEWCIDRQMAEDREREQDFGARYDVEMDLGGYPDSEDE